MWQSTADCMADCMADCSDRFHLDFGAGHRFSSGRFSSIAALCNYVHDALVKLRWVWFHWVSVEFDRISLNFTEFHRISSEFHRIPSNLLNSFGFHLNSFGFTWTHWISPKFHWISSEFYWISSEFHLSFIEFHLNSFPRTPSSFVANDGSSERTHGDSPGFAGNPKPSKLSPAKRCESARWSLGCRWAESRRTVAVQPRGDPHAERCFDKLVRLPVCVS